MQVANQKLKQDWIDALCNSSGEDLVESGKIEEWLAAPLGDGTFPSAQEYIDAGVDYATYSTWYNVSGFDIEAMQQLENEFDDVEPLGKRVHIEFGAYDATIAYGFCNGDLTLAQVKELLED